MWFEELYNHSFGKRGYTKAEALTIVAAADFGVPGLVCNDEEDDERSNHT